tara:strand:+ start:131 stop:502 length:372 start_codon:yes stop_codon:yes gene_type:complete
MEENDINNLRFSLERVLQNIGKMAPAVTMGVVPIPSYALNGVRRKKVKNNSSNIQNSNPNNNNQTNERNKGTGSLPPAIPLSAISTVNGESNIVDSNPLLPQSTRIDLNVVEGPDDVDWTEVR